MSTNNRYSLRSCAYDLGTVSSRTRSRSGDVSVVAGIASPVRKRRIRVKTEPVADSFVFKLEPNCSSSSNVHSSVQTIDAEEPLVQLKIEPLIEESSSHTFSTTTLNSSNFVPEIEYPASPVSSSRSSSPIFLRAESSASPSLTSESSLSSLSSDTSQSSTSSCSSFHLYSSSPSPPRDNDNMNYHYAPPPPLPMAINVPSYSTAKVWDWHHGQPVVRELQLVAPVKQSVCTYPRKTYYKKPYKPYLEKNLKEDNGRKICNCQCRNQNNVASFNCRAITTNQNVNKPMNIHCNIAINAPSTRQSSAFIEELSGQQPNNSKTSTPTRAPGLARAVNGSNNSKTSTQTRAPGLAPAVNRSISTPVIIPVPVPVPVPQSSYYHQPDTQISYSYMGHNVLCSTSFH